MIKPNFYTYTHFFKYVNYHPYFIFYHPNNNEIFVEDENEEQNLDLLNFKLEYFEQKLDDFVFLNFDDSLKKEYQKIELYEDKTKFIKNKLTTIYSRKISIHDSIWNDLNNYEQILLSNTMIENYVEDVIKNLIKYFVNKGFKNEEILILSKKSSKDLLVKNTIDAIKNKKYKLIINPCFEYKNVIAKPAFIDITNETVGDIVYSSKTTIESQLKAAFNINVINNSLKEIQIKEYLICKLKNHENIFYYKKGINEYDLISKISKTKDKPKIENEKNAIDIIENINIYSQNFNNFVDLVNDDKKIDEIIKNKISIPSEDNNLLDFKYKDKYKIVNQIANMFNPELALAGTSYIKIFYNVAKKNENREEIINFFSNEELIHVNKKFNLAKNEAKTNTFDIFFDKNKNKYFVWMDFEGFTSTFPIMDYHKPWLQLISQVSIVKTRWDVKTNNYEIFYSNDYVYDPLHYSHDILIQIINDIYDKNANAYVVYNKGYERARLTEIKNYLMLYFNNGSIDKYNSNFRENIFNKIDEIIMKILDLQDFTYMNNPKDFMKPLISIGFTKGRYSIKLFEKFITKYNIDIKNKIIPYANLDVQNGAMALELANLRAINRIGDLEWFKKCEDLKLYCHNDVIAMIMLGEFIWKCWNNRIEINNKFELYMNEKK